MTVASTYLTLSKKVKKHISQKCLLFKDVYWCCLNSQIAWSSAALNQAIRSLQALVSVSFLPPGITKKKATFNHSRISVKWHVCHKPNLSPSIHLVSLFSSLHPQGRESEELKVESGAAKSCWNGSLLCGGERGNAKGNPPTVAAFVRGVKPPGLGNDGGWTPRAVGSVLQRRWRQRKVIVCMCACFVHNMSTNHDPIAAPLPVDGSHTFWGLWLFLLTSTLCWELASDKIYRHWHWNSTEAWMPVRKTGTFTCVSKDLFLLQMAVFDEVIGHTEIVAVSVSLPSVFEF